MSTRFTLIALTTALAAALTLGGSAVAARRVCDDGSYPPCAKPPPAEAASNNLSFPVIWPEGVMKPDFVQMPGVEWEFADVICDGSGCYTMSGSEPVYCVGEDDITPPEKISPDVLCYYGRFNAGIDEETGEPVLTGDPKVWWLQQRAQNRWQVFNSRRVPGTDSPIVVTGVDTGDLLESSIVIKAKVIRTEFTLYKRIDAADDQDLREALTPEAGGPCMLVMGAPATNCFAAHAMSGAVPGTDRSIAETHGTDYPEPGSDVADRLDPEYRLMNPRDVKKAINYFDPDRVVAAPSEPGTESDDPDPRIVPFDEPVGMDATVYSGCARLLIQRITGDLSDVEWNSDAGAWVGANINAPVVDINTYDGSYSAEINAGGNLIYGYNWNVKSEAEGAGPYRITFVLEGDTEAGGRCTNDLNTVFADEGDGGYENMGSLSINVGERRPATILTPAALGATTRGEGGAVYVDVEIGTGGGGGGGGKKK